ncbi:toxin glutamine deamidase domain-containing protein [Streptomyces flavidovirens]|uniref:toxin glutamine deamidase domain-containing protein n=1 Tax=Streptomyces flavidovirens TaxID=67298 RepID=UPI0012FF18E7|nr:toxin glutamine deamidase domain-containing protein [Streptomyces flavidovirens]
MMLPDELEWLLKMLGYNWPTANEDLLRESAKLWRKFGDDAQKLRLRADTSARTVIAHNAGESIDKFTTHYKKFSDGASDGYLANAAEAAYILANTFEAAAYVVTFAKYAVIVQLLALAIQIAAAAAASVVTFGLSAAAGMAATQVTRVAVRRIIDALKDALMQAIIEAMKEPAVSAVQAMVTDLVTQSVNVGFGTQEGFDLSKTVGAGAKGGWEAIKQTPQTFAEGLRDGLGKKAGSSVRDGIDSGYNNSMDAYNNRSNPTAGDNSGDGGDGDSGNTSSSDGSNSSNSNASGSNSSDSSDSSTTSRSNANTGNTNIGGGISADGDGPAPFSAPDLGSLPSTDTAGSTPDAGQNPSSLNSPSRPTLSDFDDPAPSNTPPSPTPDTSSNNSSSTPGTGDTRGGSSSTGGLTAPTPQSAPTPASSSTPSSTTSGGSISTSIDSLAANIPTQSNAAPTPTTTDPSPTAGPRPDGNSSMPTSPAPPATADGAAGARTGTNTTSGGSPSGTSPTSPNPTAAPPRTPSTTPGIPNPTGPSPVSTPNPTPSTPPRSTPTPSTDGRTPGATPPGHTSSPNQNTPGGAGTRNPGPNQNTPGTSDSRPPNQNTPGSTGGRPQGQAPTTPSASDGRSPNTHQSPSSTTPSQDPRQPTPTRHSPPTATPNTANTPGSGSPARTPDTAPTPAGNTPHAPQPGAANSPTRPHQPSGSSPHTPNTPQQPSSTNPAKPSNTPNQQPQQPQPPVIAVPIHTVIPGPNTASQASNPSPSGPQAPGSPQANPGAPDKPEPQTDSLEDIRNDLDHEPGGLTEPDPQDQQLLANAVPRNPDGTPQRFPDPFGPWSQLQNDGGNEVPGRSNNCADCSRSFLETWRGNPQVSAPRTLDTDENGNLDPWSPESSANENQIRWSGAPHSYAGEGSDPDTAQRIADDLLQAGHGAHAIVQVDWPGGGGHAFNAVNHNGQVVWIDTQSGQVSHDPLHIPNAEHVWHIPMDPDGNPLHPAETGTGDSQNQNDESQADNSENAENSDSNGQPDNNTQNDASGDTPKQQTSDNEPSTESPTTADSTTPDPDPDPANSKAENEDGQTPQAPSTPDGRQTSPDDGNSTQPRQSETPEPATEQNRPSPSETPDTRDQQQRPTHTTPDNADTGTPDNISTPPRTATDSPSDPTTNRDTPQQTTTHSDPRTSIPHQQTTDPRTTDPRTADPRTSDHRASDPRTSDPHRDTPPRPDQTRPDPLEHPRSETPDRDRSELPDQPRPNDPAPDRSDSHNDRPSDMNKDSAVPTRESLPNGKNADAANYVKDSVNGKKPLYGDIAPENPAQASRPTSPERPSGPAEPAGSTPDGNGQPSGRQRDLDMLARANAGMRARDRGEESADRTWFEKYYHPNSGYRRSRTNPAEDGRPVSQLHPTNDPENPWMLANDAPDAPEETYIDEGARTGERKKGISEENQKRLDKAAKARQDAIDADWQPHKDRKAAKDAYEKNKTPENKKKFDQADAIHSPLHGEMTRASEDYGEQVAEFHAMPEHFGEYTRIDDRATGNNRFDQIWTIPDSDPPKFVVVEAKGSTDAELGQRRGIPSEEGSTPDSSPHSSVPDQTDGGQSDGQDSQDDPRPGVPKVRQGTREYFETILHEMEQRSQRILADPKKSEAEKLAAVEEAKLAHALAAALEDDPCRVTYILVKGKADKQGNHDGYEMKQFDTRPQAEKDRERNNDQDPEA